MNVQTPTRGLSKNRSMSRIPRLKYIVAAAATISWIGMVTEPFLVEGLTKLFFLAYMLSVVALFVLSIGAAVRRRWRDLAALAVIWCVVFFPFYARIAALWLRVETFRIHASPISTYLSQCKLIDFVEGGAKQQLGRCDNLVLGREEVLEVFYDTTGQIVAPPAERTPEWRAAMGHFSPTAVHLEKDHRAERLFGDFYEITLTLNDFDGSDDDF